MIVTTTNYYYYYYYYDIYIIFIVIKFYRASAEGASARSSNVRRPSLAVGKETQNPKGSGFGLRV